jgi:uncharacterized protein (TIGR02186 family)
MVKAGNVAVFLFLILAAQETSAQPTAIKWRIEPQEIPIGLFYSGTQIRISGIAQQSEDLVVVCSGEENTVELKQKGKIWGLLWVNTGEISFKHVPLLYQVASSRKLSDMAAAGDLIRAGIGIPALEAKTVPGMDEELHNSFSELMKMKQLEGLYSIQEGSLETHPRGGAQQEFSATLNFPSTVKPGEYRLRLITFVQGRAVTLAEGAISVRLAGVAAFIRSLSMKHGLVYGILSVVIALVAGLLTGFVFGRRPSKGGH